MVRGVNSVQMSTHSRFAAFSRRGERGGARGAPCWRKIAEMFKIGQFRGGTAHRIAGEWRENGDSTLQPGLGARYFLSFSPSLNLAARFDEAQAAATNSKAN